MASKESRSDVGSSLTPEEVNKSKIYYGIFKEQQALLPVFEEDEDDGEDETGTDADGKAKKKKNKAKIMSAKKMKADPHAPPQNRVPLPEMSDSFKVERQNAMKDILKRVKLCPPDKLPSICQYSILNAHNGVCSADITEDSSTLAIGFDDSLVQAWTLTSEKLKPLRKAIDLEDVDKDGDDIMEQMLDESAGLTNVSFHGHSGPVYSCNFSPDKRMLMTCSEDSTVRLWSMYTWSSLAIYRLGGFPIWDVKFGPFGYYFATATSDKTAHFWALDKPQPLRVFVGHESDVNTVAFHPNSNYIATGSDDCTVRMWDVASGHCVRHFAGHKGGIHTLQFSSDGRILASGGADGHVMIWSVGQGRQMVDLASHESTVHSISFSREGAVMATGGMDNKVKVHYMQPILAGGAEVDDHHSNVPPRANRPRMDDKPMTAEAPTMVTTSSSSISSMDITSPSVVINIPSQSSSPRSPRLAHLRPPSPLTPEAMRRIHLLSVQEPLHHHHHQYDPSKLSPISPAPSITTSDYGSSPRSSISITTPSSFNWSAYREHKKSSSDFTDVDSDMCKDLLSPSITLSPAPFSPFSDHPTTGGGMYSEFGSTPGGCGSRQRFHFSFDPKSPTFAPLMTPSRSSHFLLPPPPMYGALRERSRSDGDTSGSGGLAARVGGGASPNFESGDDESDASSTSTTTTTTASRRTDGQNKHLYKKRLLRKYEEEKFGPTDCSESGGSHLSIDEDTELDEKPSAPKLTCRSSMELCATKSVNLPTVQESSLLSPGHHNRHQQPLFRSHSSISDYGWPSSNAEECSPHGSSTSLTTPVESVRLPLLRASEEQRPEPPATTSANAAATAAYLATNQAEFDMWLRRQLIAANPMWYPPPPGFAPVPPPVDFRGRRDSQGVGPLFGSLLAPLPSSAQSTLASLHSFHRPSPIYSSHIYRPPFRYRPGPSPGGPAGPGPGSAHPAVAAAPILSPMAQLSFSRRSRSESDVSYECQHCGQSFSLRDRLAKHVASRHKEHAPSANDPNAAKNHKCSVCQKYFGRSDMLTRHMRLHTGIRPYICHTCGQVFSRSDHLSTHQRTHTGEKPYQCPICPYAASRRDMITRHMRTHSRSSLTGDESSTSTIAIEKALDKTILGEQPESSTPSATISDYRKFEFFKHSPNRLADSDSDRGSDRSRSSGGSTSTVLCMEEGEPRREVKTEPDDEEQPPS